MQNRVDAVVVNHGAGVSLRECVASLRQAGVESVIVVDNASSDRSIEQLAAVDRRAEIVADGRATSATAPASTSARVAATRPSSSSSAIPDLVVEPQAVRALVEALERDEEVAVCGPQIRDERGAVYPSARTFPSFVDCAWARAARHRSGRSNPFSRRYRREDQADDRPSVDVDWVSGACLAVRRSAFTSVGGFDEGYFMYVEDLDLCWRLKRAGWRVRYVPTAEVVHTGGVSAARHPYRMLIAHHRSTWRFARRTTRGRARCLLPVVALALLAAPRRRVGTAVDSSLRRRLGPPTK